MAGEKEVNYTAEQEAELVKRYVAGETVEALAAAFGKSARSVIAKLARAKVYVAKAKTKAEARATKADLVAKLEVEMGLEAGTLKTFEKADKAALEAAVAALV